MKYRERRRKTDFEVTLATRAGERLVVLQDIHTDGARVGLPKSPELWPGMEVALIYRDERFPAIVAWSRSGEAGLKFATPLRPSVVAVLARERHTIIPVRSPGRPSA